ncbi:MAG TPA: mechanosensitive ion channel family protein [Pyrinomonadaceae bacterium]|jgi:small-conductance mechanosensitive channel
MSNLPRRKPDLVTDTEHEVEALKQQDQIQKALKQTSSAPPAPSSAPQRQKVFLGAYVLLVLVFGGLYYLLSHHAFSLTPSVHTFLSRACLGATAIITVVAAAQSIDVYLVNRVDDRVAEYNVRRILKLVAGLLIVIILISVLFVNWYTAVVSLGVFSVIVGLAFQTTFTSFIAWVYILIRSPYRVGDRIKIDEATGDVIDVGYLDTTLWEFGGDLLSTDHPSGRVIRFPNSKVLNSVVYNYSWPLFPYIWNEIKFSVAYESDLEFVAKTMQQVAEEELGEAMLKRVRTFTKLLAETPVDRLEVRERPTVIFRVNSNTWLDAIVRYVVPTRAAGRVKSRLIKKMLARLNAEPDKVMFPKADAR